MYQRITYIIFSVVSAVATVMSTKLWDAFGYGSPWNVVSFFGTIFLFLLTLALIGKVFYPTRPLFKGFLDIIISFVGLWTVIE